MTEKMLSPTDIVRIWEIGLPQHSVDRALTILAQADPTHSRHDIADLAIGERDRRLMELRKQIFGQNIKSSADCRHCREKFECMFDTTMFGIRPPLADREEFTFTHNDYVITYRLLTSWDLAAIAAYTDEAAAAALLIERCVVDIHRNGKPEAIADSPPSVMAQLQKTMVENDPQAEILLDLRCPACETAFQVQFDIASFLWEEIATSAKRLLNDINILARAYGWSEAEILSLGPVRRRHYIERITR